VAGHGFLCSPDDNWAAVKAPLLAKRRTSKDYHRAVVPQRIQIIRYGTAKSYILTLGAHPRTIVSSWRRVYSGLALGYETFPSNLAQQVEFPMTKGSYIYTLPVIFLSAVVTLAPFKTIVNFSGSNGATPVYPGLVQGLDGNLYGTTLGGGANGGGTVFRTNSAGSVTILYSFCAQPNCADGSLPQGGLTLSIDGNFYGATTQGGTNGEGTIFKITPRGVLTTLHSFDVTDGAQPFAPPVQASDGNFYGTTNTGGLNNSGTVFKMTPQGVLTTLHSFGFADGSLPLGTLIQATDGALYGTTELGGGGACDGSVFRITTRGTFITLHGFNCSDGRDPASGLIQAIDGNLYGTAYDGGTNNTCNNGCGTVFKISLSGNLNTLYNFDLTHGANPISALVQANDGNFYGTTYAGGASSGYGWGTIFKMTPAGVLTTLHSFDLTDGAQPYGSLIQATTGSFFGTTPYGGSAGGGTVFALAVGLGPFVQTLPTSAKVGMKVAIQGNNLIGTTSVTFKGAAASFKVLSDTEIGAVIPAGAGTGRVEVVTPGGTLHSKLPFYVIP
jgi:uncharacterized repeat protein (TIGR03803 family)